MKALLARGERIARDRTERAVERIVAEWRAAGFGVARDGLTLLVSGRALGRRLLAEPALRWLGRA